MHRPRFAFATREEDLALERRYTQTVLPQLLATWSVLDAEVRRPLCSGPAAAVPPPPLHCAGVAAAGRVLLNNSASPAPPPPSPPEGCIGRGGGTFQGAQPMPSHCPPDAKCRLQWHL